MPLPPAAQHQAADEDGVNDGPSSYPPTLIMIFRCGTAATPTRARNRAYRRSARGYQELPQRQQSRPRPSRQAAGPYVYASPALGVIARSADGVGRIDSERFLTPTLPLPLRCRLASAKMRSDHLLCMAPGWCAVSPLTTTSTAMSWSSGWRSSIRSSSLARSVETQNDLDDRPLPDRLRSLHRYLDGH